MNIVFLSFSSNQNSLAEEEIRDISHNCVRMYCDLSEQIAWCVKRTTPTSIIEYLKTRGFEEVQHSKYNLEQWIDFTIPPDFNLFLKLKLVGRFTYRMIVQ